MSACLLLPVCACLYLPHSPLRHSPRSETGCSPARPSAMQRHWHARSGPLLRDPTCHPHPPQPAAPAAPAVPAARHGCGARRQGASGSAGLSQWPAGLPRLPGAVRLGCCGRGGRQRQRQQRWGPAAAGVRGVEDDRGAQQGAHDGRGGPPARAAAGHVDGAAGAAAAGPGAQQGVQGAAWNSAAQHACTATGAPAGALR